MRNYDHIFWHVGGWGRGEHTHIIVRRLDSTTGNTGYSVYCTGEVMRGGITRATQVSEIGPELTAETASQVTCKKCLKWLALMVEHAAKYQRCGGYIKSVEEAAK